MRLLSATVRNYRIHEEVHVDFEPGLNLICGPNESGKSTLAEAIHRGLFLRAATTGIAREAMLSRRGGHPSVELRFVSRGKTWHLSKTFSGPSGSASLREEGREPRRGDEAEAQLADLLGVEQAGGGKGGAKKAAEQWGHLWVWQGHGGADPAVSAESESAALLSRLKERGGGAVMQSAFDAKVVDRVQREYERSHTAGGKVKADSALHRAKERLEEARSRCVEAEASFRRLDAALATHEQAGRLIAEKGAALVQLEKDLAAVAERLAAVSALQHRIELAEPGVRAAQERAGRFETLLGEIESLEREIEALGAASLGTEERLSRIEGSRGTAADALAAAEARLGEIGAALETARREERLQQLAETLARLASEGKALEGRAEEIEALRQDRRRLAEEHAALPPVDEAGLTRLRDFEAAVSKAEAVVRAIAAGVEVVRSDGPVRVGETLLAAGESLAIEEETLVEAGEHLVLKISPGGGSTLAEARERVAGLLEEQAAAYAALGIESLEEAVRLRARREELERREGEVKARLEALDEAQIERRREALSRERSAAAADWERRAGGQSLELWLAARSEAASGAAAAATTPDATALEEDLASARGEVQHRKASLAEAERGREEALAASRESEVRRVQQAARLEEKLAALSECGEHEAGDLAQPEARRRLAAALGEARDRAAAGLAALRDELAALQPEELRSDRGRLERAIVFAREGLESARQDRAVAASTLASDGSVDPAGWLAQAKARLAGADELHARLERRAEAVKLLRETFAEAQQQLSDRLSQPLAEEVTRFLQPIFGPGASATVEVETGVVKGFAMSREGEAFAFEKLSGGTREQVAAAVRLAMAALLASEHEGTLPVLFDDAFTNSDPERVRSLHRMLDLAAREGLQVLLLTCAPADYIGLGARETSL